MTKPKPPIPPPYIMPKLTFILFRSREQILKWCLVPYVFIYDFKRFGLNVSPDAKKYL